MLGRRLSVPFALAAILLLGAGLTTPAGAVAAAPMVAPAPVSGLAVTGQTQGANQSWVVAASWSPVADATGYTVKITDGSGTVTYRAKDADATTTTLTADNLVGGRTYLLSVQSFNAADEYGTPVTAAFTAIPLDRTAPTGTFTVTPTRAFLASDFLSFEDASASVVVKQTALSDDTTAVSSISRRVTAGDGTAAKTWTSGAFTITYTRPGTFTPQVLLTDTYGNARTVSLGSVTISEDGIAPVVRVTPPSVSMRTRVAGWRVVRGTATDAGSGVDRVFVIATEKRNGYWYVYNFRSRSWLKGTTREIQTLNRTKAMPAFVSVNSLHQWRTPWIRGLRTGTLVVRTAALDRSGNIALGPVLRQKLTRR